ncbi:MAG: sigma-70 family RNA polymerase sigma factor [Actinomycetota bacterium]|nr:sigma-70 family RNA polymerase sigma factor [Actinomycetota bacterium]
MGRAGEEATEKVSARSPQAGEEVEADVLDLAAMVRRVLGARLSNPQDIEDLAQETLARVIEARPRITDEGLAAYAVVTARNLARSLGRDRARHRQHAHRLIDLRTPSQPEEETLRREESAAVSAALEKLSPREKFAVIGHEVGGRDTATLGLELGVTPGAVAVQLARARAKLRVDYLLALRKANPPTPVCRSVLVALSAGDQRRQAALDTADHLLHCEYCAALSEPLLQRRRPVGLLLPLAALRQVKEFIGQRLQTTSAQATAAAAGTAVAVASVALIMSGGGAQSPAPRKEPLGMEGRLTTSGKVLPTTASKLERHVGKRVKAHGVTVESVPSDEGFWIGSNEARVFVRFMIPGRRESPVRIESGKRVTFTGTLRRHQPGFARRHGVTEAEGAAELRRSPQHIVTSMKEIKARV